MYYIFCIYINLYNKLYLYVSFIIYKLYLCFYNKCTYINYTYIICYICI